MNNYKEITNIIKLINSNGRQGPKDLLSEEAMDLDGFCENVCMEECKVHVFAGDEGPDFEIILYKI